MSRTSKLRSWRQFSVRALLAIVFAGAVVFAIAGKRLHFAEQQRTAVSEIVASGGMVFYSYHLDNDGMARLAAPNKLADPNWYTSLATRVLGDDFTADVVGAYVNVKEPGDPIWAHLSKLKGLQNLSISGNITDEDLDALEGLDRLATLEVGSASVTRKRVAVLQKSLPNCNISR